MPVQEVKEVILFEKADKKIWTRMDAILCIHLYSLVYKTPGEHKQTLPRHAHGTR